MCIVKMWCMKCEREEGRGKNTFLIDCQAEFQLSRLAGMSGCATNNRQARLPLSFLFLWYRRSSNYWSVAVTTSLWQHCNQTASSGCQFRSDPGECKCVGEWHRVSEIVKKTYSTNLISKGWRRGCDSCLTAFALGQAPGVRGCRRGALVHKLGTRSSV